MAVAALVPDLLVIDIERSLGFYLDVLGFSIAMVMAASPVSRTERSRGRLRRRGRHLQHRLIDDMVAAALKWEGGYVRTCRTYEGNVHSQRWPRASDRRG